MPSQKELKSKITSLQNIEKITAAMGMIAMARLQKYIAVQTASQAYLAQVERLAASLVRAAAAGDRLPFVHGYAEARCCDIVIVTADRGLCGPFNHEAVRAAAALADGLRKKNLRCSYYFIGSKGLRYGKQYALTDPVSLHVDARSLTHDSVKETADLFLDRFRGQKSHELHIVYNHYISSVNQTPVARRILPLQPQQAGDEKTSVRDYLAEPALPALIGHSMQRMVAAYLYNALMESITGEHAARMTAMQNASANCETLLDNYVRVRNRMRQSSITTELTEIISGMEAQ
jgi:F-type H+-transporting ATPase subunit gamma